MHQFIKFGLSLVGVVCLMAGPAWAQDDGSESTTSTITTTSHWKILLMFLNGIQMAVCYELHFVAPAKAQTTSLAHLRVVLQGQIRLSGRAEPPAADTTGCVTLSRQSSGHMARIITVVQTANTTTRARLSLLTSRAR